MPCRPRQTGICRGRRWLAAAGTLGLTAPRALAAGRSAWLGPELWAWWALLGSLAAFLIVFLILRSVGYRRLSRLWQCVAASVLAHVALTAGLSLVVVTQPVLSLLTRADPREASVNLVVGHEAQLRTQVRTQVTELPVADPSLAVLMRAAPEAIRTPDYERTELPAPLSEPQRQDMADAPEAVPLAPPAPAERLRLRPPGSEAPRIDTLAPPHRPVAAAEGRPRADAEQAVQVPPRPTPRPQPETTWKASEPAAPKARVLAESVVEAAARTQSALPRDAEENVLLRHQAAQPDVEIPHAAAAVQSVEDRPVPVTAAPETSVERRPVDPASDRATPATPSPPRPAEMHVETLALAAPRMATQPARAEAVDRPRHAPRIDPDLRPAPNAAERFQVDELPVSAARDSAAPLTRKPTGPPAARSSTASLPSPARIPPADPRGGALTGHLAARPGARVARGWQLERFHPAMRAALPAGLAIAKIEIDEPIVRARRSGDRPPPPPRGGTKISEQAVQRALAYLARNQEPDGRWTLINEEADAPGQRPRNKDDTGLTGLVLLAFLADGDRPDRRGTYQRTVAAGLGYLLRRQGPDGDLRGDGDMYSHGIATLALGESAAMTGNALYGRAAILAAKFIVRAQNPQSGGWRYEPEDVGDTSVLGWQVMALHSVARLRDFAIPRETRAGVFRWLASVGRGRHGMLTGYQTAKPTRAMTAEGLFVRILLDQRLTKAQLAEATDYLRPPGPISLSNLYEWYYGSLALMQLQSPAWAKWNPVVRDRLTASQIASRDALDGSWDPAGSAWGAERGGRIYATALAALTLEVYYRYLPMLSSAPGTRPD